MQDNEITTLKSLHHLKQFLITINLVILHIRFVIQNFFLPLSRIRNT